MTSRRASHSDLMSVIGAITDEKQISNDKRLQREQRVRQSFWRKIRGVISRVPFAEDLIAAYYSAMDPQTPQHVRTMLIGALLYFIMPVDVVPDVIVCLGFTDDAAILAAVLKKVADHIRPVHRIAARDTLKRFASEV